MDYNVTTTESPNNTKIDTITETHGELKPIKQNKTVVKRSASENTHLFWNDLYDDEYGVEDPLGKYFIIIIKWVHNGAKTIPTVKNEFCIIL